MLRLPGFFYLTRISQFCYGSKVSSSYPTGRNMKQSVVISSRDVAFAVRNILDDRDLLRNQNLGVYQSLLSGLWGICQESRTEDAINLALVLLNGLDITEDEAETLLMQYGALSV